MTKTLCEKKTKKKQTLPVVEARFVCKKCGEKAIKKKYVCKPQKLSI